MTTDDVALSMMGRVPKDYKFVPTKSQVREAEAVKQAANVAANPSAFEMPKSREQKIEAAIVLLKKKFVGARIGDLEVTGVAETLVSKKDVWVYLELKKVADKSEPIGEIAMTGSDMDKATDEYEKDAEIAVLKPTIKVSIRQEYYAWPAKSVMGKKIAKLLNPEGTAPAATKKTTKKAAALPSKTPNVDAQLDQDTPPAPAAVSDKKAKKNESKSGKAKKVKPAF